MTAGAKPDAATPRRMPTWVLAVIAGAFGLLYAYAVWNAIWNLVLAVQTYAAVGRPLNALGWFLWIFAALLAIIVYAAAFALARRRRAWQAALILLAGLALVAVFWLDVVGYSILNTFSLVS